MSRVILRIAGVFGAFIWIALLAFMLHDSFK